MEKYARVLVIIFFLILINLGLSFYVISKLNKPTEVIQVTPTTTKVTTSPSAQIVATPPSSIQSDLNLIKAEVRALRDSLEVSGLITESPTPKP